MKHTFKAPRSKRLKLKCDNLLSSFAFNFNLRRYNVDNTKQCENGCKSCMTVAHYELDTMFECDDGMVMTGFVDAVYGDSAVLPQLAFDMHPGMCFQSMIPTVRRCRLTLSIPR